MNDTFEDMYRGAEDGVRTQAFRSSNTIDVLRDKIMDDIDVDVVLDQIATVRFEVNRLLEEMAIYERCATIVKATTPRRF